jgi:hypothetical protein
MYSETERSSRIRGAPAVMRKWVRARTRVCPPIPTDHPCCPPVGQIGQPWESGRVSTIRFGAWESLSPDELPPPNEQLAAAASGASWVALMGT